MRCEFSQNPILPWVITPKMLGNGSSPHQPMMISLLFLTCLDTFHLKNHGSFQNPHLSPDDPGFVVEFLRLFPTLPTITGVALLQHAVEVGAQVGHRGEAFIEAHDAATVLPVRDQSLPQLHEEIQPRKIAARIN